MESLYNKYCPRFGAIAMEMGFISRDQLIQALGHQVYEKLEGAGHRPVGAIMFEKGWMSSCQVDRVATELLKRMRQESA